MKRPLDKLIFRALFLCYIVTIQIRRKMNKYLIITILFLSLMGFSWMYFLTNQVTKYDTAIENCIQKMDSLETRTQILEALVEKQSEQNNKHEVTIYLKTK